MTEQLRLDLADTGSAELRRAFDAALAAGRVTRLPVTSTVEGRRRRRLLEAIGFMSEDLSARDQVRAVERLLAGAGEHRAAA